MLEVILEGDATSYTSLISRGCCQSCWEFFEYYRNASFESDATLVLPLKALLCSLHGFVKLRAVPINKTRISALLGLKIKWDEHSKEQYSSEWEADQCACIGDRLDEGNHCRHVVSAHSGSRVHAHHTNS